VSRVERVAGASLGAIPGQSQNPMLSDLEGQVNQMLTIVDDLFSSFLVKTGWVIFFMANFMIIFVHM
jgi:hypothetical protein